MSRAKRFEINGGIYHVIARGNNKDVIFRENIDKGYFIKQLKEYCVSKGFKIFAYVLMNNHYHIVLQTADVKLHEIMHAINSKYSKYFNFKYERVGHVFQGRYRSIPVQDERQFLNLIKYIHQNPVRAELVKFPQDYKWSSDSYYRKKRKGFVETGILLKSLDDNLGEAVQKYINSLLEPAECKYYKDDALGTDEYKSSCKNREKIPARKRLDEILFDTGISIDDYTLVKSGSRKRRLSKFKFKYASVAKKSNYSYNEIGANIGMTDSGIKEMIDRNEKNLQEKGDTNGK